MRSFDIYYSAFEKAKAIVESALAEHLDPDNIRDEKIYFGVLAEINRQFFEVLLEVYLKRD